MEMITVPKAYLSELEKKYADVLRRSGNKFYTVWEDDCTEYSYPTLEELREKHFTSVQ